MLAQLVHTVTRWLGAIIAPISQAERKRFQKHLIPTSPHPSRKSWGLYWILMSGFWSSTSGFQILLFPFNCCGKLLSQSEAAFFMDKMGPGDPLSGVIPGDITTANI